jgi:hypothetical protein
MSGSKSKNEGDTYLYILYPLYFRAEIRCEKLMTEKYGCLNSPTFLDVFKEQYEASGEPEIKEPKFGVDSLTVIPSWIHIGPELIKRKWR